MAIMILLASSQHNLCLKMETEPASEMLCFFNKLDNGRWEGGEIVLANFNQALFSLLSAHWHFSNAGLALAPHGPVQSDPVWRGPVRCFIM